MLPYTLRYGVLSYSEFSPYVLVGNPNYGKQIFTPLGIMGSRPVIPDSNRFKVLEARDNFFTKLEESILKEGFLNPIFAFQFPSGLFSKIGTSRLWIAVKHKLEVPTIIANYVAKLPLLSKWNDLEELKSISDIESKFTHPPKIIDINPVEPVIQFGFHYHQGYHRWEDMEKVRNWNEG